MNFSFDDERLDLVPQLRAELMALVRRRWWIAGVTLFCLAVSTIYNVSVRPLYAAVAIIEAGQSPDPEPARLAKTIDEEIVRLTSRDVAQKVVQQLGPREAVEIAQGPIRSWYRRLFSWGNNATPPSAADAADALRSRLRVQWKDPSPWLQVTVIAYAPEAALGLAEGVIAEYSVQTVAASQKRARARREAFAQHIENKEVDLHSYQEALRQRGDEPGAAAIQARKQVIEQQIRLLQEALLAAQVERLGNAPLPRSASSGGPAPDTVSPDPKVADARSRLADLEDRERELLATLGERHPEAVTAHARVLSARDRLTDAVAVSTKAAQLADMKTNAGEARLDANLARLQKELATLQESSSAFTTAQKKVDAGRLVLDELLRRDESSIPDLMSVKVIQSATASSEPWSPRAGENTTRALFVGLLAGIGLAFALNRMDDTIQFPDQLDPLKLRFLGLVLFVPNLRPGSIQPAMVDDKTGFGDGIRTIRTNLIYGTPPVKGRVVVLTSASSGEGKSTIAASIGLALAESSHRVLVIDGDLRRPSMHDLLDVEAQPGLSELLAMPGPVALRTVPGPIRGLDVLAAGSPRIASTALLGSENMKSLLAQAKTMYDWIVIDSPPSLGLSDASVLATLADGVVIVCAGDKTPRLALRTVSRQLNTVGANILGVVLNRVNMNRHPYFYGRYYAPYYGPERSHEPSLPGTRDGAPTSEPSFHPPSPPDALRSSEVRAPAVNILTGNAPAPSGEKATNAPGHRAHRRRHR